MLKKGLVIIFSISVMICAINAYAAEESITITTYYPSPYGSYRELETEILYLRETGNGKIAFNYPDNTYDRRLRITAGRNDTGNNDQGASIDLHGINYGSGKSGDLDLVAGQGGNITFFTSPTGQSALPRMRIAANGAINTCVRVNYDSASGPRNCPSGYYITLGSALNTTPALPDGYIICCQACQDGGASAPFSTPDGICD